MESAWIMANISLASVPCIASCLACPSSNTRGIHKIAWISHEHKTATHIDHLAVGPIWRASCLQDIRVYHDVDIWSYCRLVIAKIEIKLKRLKKGSQVIRQFDTGKLWDPATQLRFQAVLQNRFAALANPAPGSTEWWNERKEGMKKTGKEVLRY